jgi:hypothetical protein
MKKQKKPFITRVRMFIAAGSIAGLAGGWALLAQADASQATANATAAIVEMAPAQSTGFGLTTPAASNTVVATAITTTTASTSTPAATATKVTTTTTRPVLRTRSS